MFSFSAFIQPAVKGGLLERRGVLRGVGRKYVKGKNYSITVISPTGPKGKNVSARSIVVMADIIFYKTACSSKKVNEGGGLSR